MMRSKKADFANRRYISASGGPGFFEGDGPVRHVVIRELLVKDIGDKTAMTNDTGAFKQRVKVPTSRANKRDAMFKFLVAGGLANEGDGYRRGCRWRVRG